MSYADFLNAMLFFHDSPYIIIQVPRLNCLPLIKRMTISYLGEPSMMNRASIYYGKKFIKFVIVGDEQSTRGYGTDNLFYVGCADEKELSLYEQADVGESYGF